MSDELAPWGAAPRDGEHVCGCGHTPRSLLSDVDPRVSGNSFEWFELTPPMVMNSPQGPFPCRWLVLCGSCKGAATRLALERPMRLRAEVFVSFVRDDWRLGAAPDHHANVLALRGDAEAISAYLEKLDDAELAELARRGKLAGPW